MRIADNIRKLRGNKSAREKFLFEVYTPPSYEKLVNAEHGPMMPESTVAVVQLPEHAEAETQTFPSALNDAVTQTDVVCHANH